MIIGKEFMILRGIFCAPSAVPIGPRFFISFSLSWKKGLLWEWCPFTEARVPSKDFEKCLFRTLQWLENDGLWVAQYEKNMGAFLERGPQMKKICSHWKTICECQIVQSCNGLQKIFYVWVGRGEQEEGVREGKGKKREEKKNRCES